MLALGLGFWISNTSELLKVRLLTKNMYRITILVLNCKHNSGTTKTTELKCMIAAILTKL